MAAAWCLLAAAGLAPLADAFYLPGVAPREYEQGAKVSLKVNKLTSAKTQLPYGYYTLPYCQPEKITESAENLGEILTGDQIENSPYDIKMLVNDTCRLLCKKTLTEDVKQSFRNMIAEDYMVNWIVDNLPAATRYVRRDGTGNPLYMSGFPAGVLKDGRYFVHNHVKLQLKYHQEPTLFEGYRIVGFEVEPQSVIQGTRDDPDGGQVALCQDSGAQVYDLDAVHSDIIFTYDVMWVESPIRWASRWDNYLKMEGGQVHWFSIMNSVMIVLFLSAMVAMIILRTIFRDITKYNELATAEEAAEETGWKLVHGDVFRAPARAELLAASVGCGAQVLGMSVLTLGFALMGFMSPAHRGGLLQFMMLLYTFMGVLGGYVSARFYKVMGGEKIRTMTAMTAVLFPGVMFGIFFVLNLLIWEEKSSGAVPFTTMFAILVLWFGISVPLVLFGAFAGLRRPAIELPVATKPVPRQIPEQPWFVQPFLNSMIGGVLPFGAVFTELFFIMSSVWQHQFYYLFGFLALVLCILLVTCAEIAIALTYFQLTAEDYQWWWRSFFASGSSAVYVFLYSILYYNTRLQIDKLSGSILYFGYMGMMSCLFGLLTGSIGFIASFFFIRAIYASIKID